MSDAGNPHPSTGPPALPPNAGPKPAPSAVGCVVVPLVVALAVVVAIVVAVVANAGSDDDAAPTTTVAGSWSPVRTAPATPTGELFTGTDGSYSLTIEPAWTELTGSAAQAWAVADPVDGFVPNVNVVTQPAPDLTLAQYVDASVASLSGFDVVDSGIVETSNGQVGLIEYAGTPRGAPGELHFLAVLALGDDAAAVATFTAPTSTFQAHRAEIEPYLFTLTVS